MVNQSKINDPRFWAKWKESGAVGTIEDTIPRIMQTNTPGSKDYNVVFAYTSACGGYEGVRTWTSFRNKAHFEEWYTEGIRKKQNIFAEGVTAEKAVEICGQTPFAYRLFAAIDEATDPKTGEIEPLVFNMEMTKIILGEIL